MNHDDVIAKSRELDVFLQRAKRDLMPITDGEPLLSITDMVAEIRKAKNEFRQGIHEQLAGMARDIRANGAAAIQKVAEERSAVRDEFTELLGNEIIDTSTSVDHTKSDDTSGA